MRTERRDPVAAASRAAKRRNGPFEFCRGTRRTGGRRTSGRTGERADERTSGRTDGGTAVAARGGGCGLCGVILLLRHPGRRPRRLTRLNSEGFVRGAGRGPRPPPPPPPSPPLSAQYTHGLTPPPRPLSPTHPPRSIAQCFDPSV